MRSGILCMKSEGCWLHPECCPLASQLFTIRTNVTCWYSNVGIESFVRVILLVVFAQDITAKIIGEVTHNRMNVVRIVLRIVHLN